MCMTSKGIPPMHGKALQAFRNNDFSPDSAIAEVIDNSIQANAKNIKLRIDFKKTPGKNKPRPFTIAFGDDGIGMGEKILQICLVLGESTRGNDRNGIGRFGVGMTNGAISVCNKIQVYSRPRQGNWNYVELDLKKLDDDGAPYITIIEPKPLPDEYKDLVGDTGTLVIWSDIDRIRSDFNSQETDHWLSRTFRKFIGEQIIEKGEVIDNPNKITLSMDVTGEDNVPDGHTELIAFDPLYIIENKKRPNDGLATLLDDATYTFDISEIDKPDGTEKTGKITIRLSLTPKKWRLKEKGGGSPENNARYLYDNQGISILRNQREVAYDHIPNWTTQFSLIDRYWSCEIDFDAVLDFQFSVKNIKVGARPLKELREFLQKQINPTRAKKLEEIREIWNQSKSDAITGGGSTGGHDGSMGGQGGVIIPKPKKPLTPEEKKKQEEALKRKQINEEETRQILKAIADPESPPILLYDSLKDSSTGNYIEIEPLGNKTVVWLNMNHQFFLHVYDRLKEIDKLAKDSVDPDKSKLIELASELKTDIDNLIISYTDTHNNLIKTEKDISDPLEKLMIGWSLCLRKLYRNS